MALEEAGRLDRAADISDRVFIIVAISHGGGRCHEPSFHERGRSSLPFIAP